ncbi:hypothetical protein QJQ45_026099, partial [Haematococcus lacustris]
FGELVTHSRGINMLAGKPSLASCRVNAGRRAQCWCTSGVANPSSAPTTLKRLILLRHGDSEENPKVRDHDRALSALGKKQALAVASQLEVNYSFTSCPTHPPTISHPPTLTFLKNCSSARSWAQYSLSRCLAHLGSRYTSHTVSQVARVTVMCWCAAQGWRPDLILASNATRTRETLMTMMTASPALEQVDAHYYGSLYTVAALDGQTQQHLSECLLEVVNSDKHSCVMCVGHNKGWEEAASSWSGRAIKLGTATAALLQVSQLADTSGTSWPQRLPLCLTANALPLRLHPQVVAASWSEALAEDGTGKWECVAIVGADV